MSGDFKKSEKMVKCQKKIVKLPLAAFQNEFDILKGKDCLKTIQNFACLTIWDIVICQGILPIYVREMTGNFIF